MKYLLFLYLLFSLAKPNLATAQVGSNDVISGDNQDSVAAARNSLLRPYDNATFTLEDKPIDLSAPVVITQDQTLHVKVLHLKPNSTLRAVFRKAEVRVKEFSFKADGLGVIEFTVDSPTKKIGGMAEVNYIASSGKAVSFRVKVKVGKATDPD